MDAALPRRKIRLREIFLADTRNLITVQHLPYFNVNPLLAGKFTIEIGRRPRREAPLASRIEVFRRKIERGLNIYEIIDCRR